MTHSDYVFMSYRSVEAEIALKVAQDLRNAGIFVWMDQLDGLKTGDNWVAELQHAIDKAQAMLVMLSPQYLRSRFCNRELLRADGIGYPILPLLIEDVSPSEVSLVLQNVQHIDFRQWSSGDTYQNQLKQLKQHLLDKVNFDTGDAIPLVNTPMDNGGAAAARKLEDTIANAQKVVNASVVERRSAKMKRERLSKQLDQHEKEYEVATNQLLAALEEVVRLRLSMQLVNIERAMEQLETELDTLES